jgi:hypothetical protein
MLNITNSGECNALDNNKVVSMIHTKTYAVINKFSIKTDDSGYFVSKPSWTMRGSASA